MNTYRTFEDLQNLGTDKIHEKTHISRDKVELLLSKSYGLIGKVQFMGFMSILEREYGIDLSDIRQEYVQYRQENPDTLSAAPSAVLQAKSNAKQKWVIAGAVFIALLMGGGYVLQGMFSNEPREELMKLSSVTVAPPVPQEALIAAEEANATAESNATAAAEANVTVPTGVSADTTGKTITIRPLYKVWAGMVDLESGEKTQQVTSGPIVIDADKKWLIVLGHGRVEIVTAEGTQTLKETVTVRMLAENGTLKRLSKEEFLELNGGKNW